ncbi:MAG: response regulator transcription factor [Clostridia bacterium]|nr:response regulator transcription factor [Clostridia bacterium]
MKILIADDESEIRTVLKLILEGAGYSVIEAKDGTGAVEAVEADRGIDLCIMDIMMPRLDGIAATAKIREICSVPVLFLSAKSLDKDKADAYSAGGDDYIVKPFGAGELLMKVEALTRRYNMYQSKGEDSSEIIRIGRGVTICPEMRQVEKNGRTVEMRDKEYEVLLYLAKNRGRAVDTGELYSAVWGEIPLLTAGNTVTVHILNLRRKLEDTGSSPKIIRTVWGKGYQID